jgi:hypothetical protein
MSPRDDRPDTIIVYLRVDPFSAPDSVVSGVPDPAPGETLCCAPDERAPEVPRNTRGNSFVTPSRLAPCLVLPRVLPRDPPHSGEVLQWLLTCRNLQLTAYVTASLLPTKAINPEAWTTV